MVGQKSCLCCNGAKKITIKSDSGKKQMVPCPVCGGSGKDVLVVK